MIRIVVISPYLFRLHRGIERGTYSLANKLARRGVRVTIYSWSAPRSPVNWGRWHPGIKIRTVPSVRYLQSLLASWFYKIWLRMDKPDVVILNFLYHGEHRLPAHHKFLYILHTLASGVPGRYRFIRQQIRRFPSMEFVAVSEMVKREAMPYLGDRKITVIHNGVDTELFVPADNQAANDADHIKIITAAALDEQKGIHHIIKLLGSLSEEDRRHYKYDIYGDGHYKDALQSLIRQLHLEKVVALKQAVNNLHEVLPRYDLFCLMSEAEAMGMAALEAIACGLPVLTSDCPAFKEFITPDIGLTVSCADSRQIMEFINDCKSKRRENNWSHAARERSLQFSWDVVADKYLAQLRRIKQLPGTGGF
ncbi:glycosyltransferase family 4 protein [Flavitalea sp. BT771]|uniref:glycosyltransferase family 4 protein n=1 Tax=Flavitalea sp. BT771 TaxID=3063329 RepID=UPI0026E28235|nr:glycosyltransferase family 4 protein [Flavitalea sp. BT771]MDO6429410.1 glycosyltransferase family 4 protein [Flavitalea sp. BT771]MDV6218462.1 glycosyltransferase family 4 protein [Flavitalea sp. BT771]